MVACGPGQSCCGTCNSGMGEFEPTFPAVEKIIRDYIADMNARQMPWYISDELNSDLYPPQPIGFGFWTAVLAAVAKVATTVGSTAVKLAPTIANAAGTAASIRASQPQQPGGASVTNADIAAQITPQVLAALRNQGITLPNAIAQPAVNASLGGLLTGYTPILIGAGILAAVLLLR